MKCPMDVVISNYLSASEKTNLKKPIPESPHFPVFYDIVIPDLIKNFCIFLGLCRIYVILKEDDNL